jgi:quercetin dioxygenase-like cupin family protein
MTKPHASAGSAHKRPAEKISGLVVTANLEAELKSLRESESYRRNDHASTTIVNRPGLGAVLIALPKGGHLAEHRATRPIMLRVLEGRIRIVLEERTLEMARGDLTALAPNLSHEVTGLEESAFLLTMGGEPST